MLKNKHGQPLQLRLEMRCARVSILLGLAVFMAQTFPRTATVIGIIGLISAIDFVWRE